jgi:hypothetical protein
MTGLDWRLRTAASTGLLFIPGWCAMCTMVWWYRLGLTPNLSTRELWQPPVLAGGPVSKDISGASTKMGEGNKNLICSSLWDFKRSLTAYILRPPASLRMRRNVCCGFLSPLKIHRIDRVRNCDLWVQWQAHSPLQDLGDAACNTSAGGWKRVEMRADTVVEKWHDAVICTHSVRILFGTRNTKRMGLVSQATMFG